MPGDAATGGFIPPIYPYARLDALKQRAAEAPGGIVDLSIGTPNDPVPDIVVAALAAAGPGSAGYPRAVGGPALREAAAGWMEGSLGVVVDPVQVVNCIGTKEVVPSLPHLLRLRDPPRDTLLSPAVSYPTYAMGALLGGCRAVPVPLGDGWHLDLSAVSDDDAARALLLWVNEPGNPTGSQSNSRPPGGAPGRARGRGVLVGRGAGSAGVDWGGGGVLPGGRLGRPRRGRLGGHGAAGGVRPPRGRRRPLRRRRRRLRPHRAGRAPGAARAGLRQAVNR